MCIFTIAIHKYDIKYGTEEQTNENNMEKSSIFVAICMESK